MVCPYCQSNDVKKVFSDRCQCQYCKGIFHPKESFKGNYVNYYYEDKKGEINGVIIC